MQRVKKDAPQETVLLRHAQPKYGFQGKKIDKPRKIQPQSPAAKVVPPPYVNIPSTTTTPIKTNTVSLTQTLHYAEHDSQRKNAGIVKPISAGIVDNHVDKPQSSQQIQLPHQPIKLVSAVQVVPAVQHVQSQQSQANGGNGGFVAAMPNPAETIFKMEKELGLGRANAEEMEKLKNENQTLKQDLDVQIKVNGELKKLLVASVGEDLERRVERLARDKAELSEEVGGYSKKMSEDYEHLDKVSIQADMWRSKFLASRVMIDELASARAFYSLQYQESQDALQQLLTERHELRANLLETFKVLQQVKGAFDPLNAHKSISLPSTNVVDLARNSQQLSEAIRYRLLPGQLNIHTVLNIDDQLHNCLTPAESFAEELMSRQTKLDPVHKSVSGNLFGPEGGQGGTRIHRYHPRANFDNLTVNCCVNCKGDINVL